MLSEKKQSVTIKMLSDFLNSIESEELLLAQRLKDRAMRNLYVVEGGKVNLEEFEHKPKIGEMTEKENIRLIVNNQGEESCQRYKNDIDTLKIEFESYEGL